MTVTLRGILAIGVIIYFVIILRLLKKKRLFLKYALLWLACGAGVALLLLFPQLLNIIAMFMGVAFPVNALFVIGIFAIIIIVLSLTSIVSRQEEKIRRLAQQIAFLEKRLREIEDDKENE